MPWYIIKRRNLQCHNGSKDSNECSNSGSRESGSRTLWNSNGWSSCWLYDSSACSASSSHSGGCWTSSIGWCRTCTLGQSGRKCSNLTTLGRRETTTGRCWRVWGNWRSNTGSWWCDLCCAWDSAGNGAGDGTWSIWSHAWGSSCGGSTGSSRCKWWSGTGRGCSVAGQVKERSLTIRSNNAERWAWCSWCSVLQSIPVHVDLSESWASNSIPESLCILSAWNGKIFSWSTNWPSSLGQPQLLSLGECSCLREGRLVELGTALNTIWKGVLEVWEGIDSDKVNSINDSLVGTVDICSPSINVANWLTSQRSTGNCLSELTNISCKCLWWSTVTRIGSNTSWADSV